MARYLHTCIGADVNVYLVPALFSMVIDIEDVKDLIVSLSAI